MLDSLNMPVLPLCNKTINNQFLQLSPWRCWHFFMQPTSRVLSKYLECSTYRANSPSRHIRLKHTCVQCCDKTWKWCCCHQKLSPDLIDDSAVGNTDVCLLHLLKTGCSTDLYNHMFCLCGELPHHLSKKKKSRIIDTESISLLSITVFNFPAPANVSMGSKIEGT